MGDWMAFALILMVLDLGSRGHEDTSAAAHRTAGGRPDRVASARLQPRGGSPARPDAKIAAVTLTQSGDAA